MALPVNVPPPRLLGRFVTNRELTQRQLRSVQYRIAKAKFGQCRSIAQFNFKDSPVHQPAIDLLMEGNYIADKRNIIFVGEYGTGKTHLASSLGIEAATHGAKVRFFNVLDLVNQRVGQRPTEVQADATVDQIRCRHFR